MKRTNLRLYTLLLTAILVYIFTSCTKDEEAPAYSMPCLDWKANKNNVADYMKDFTLEDEEPNYLYYAGKKIEYYISYEFLDNLLCTVAVIIPNSSISLSDLEGTLGTYTYLGELNGTQIFVNEKKNTVATINTYLKDKACYYAIAWSRLYP